MQKQVQLLISGQVQGVFFRVSTREKAKQLGLNGWVKNVADGQVLTVATGEEKIINEFIAWCHDGPELANVDHVQIKVITEPLNQTDFAIL